MSLTPLGQGGTAPGSDFTTVKPGKEGISDKSLTWRSLASTVSPTCPFLAFDNTTRERHEDYFFDARSDDLVTRRVKRQTEDICAGPISMGNRRMGLASFWRTLPIPNSDFVFVIESRGSQVLAVRTEGHLLNAHSQRCSHSHQTFFGLVVPDAQSGSPTDLASSHDGLAWMQGQTVDVVVVLTEEGLSVGGLVVHNAECCGVIHQLLLVMSVEQIVAHIVAPVTEDILQLEVGIRGSSISL